ncbi:MAG: DNA-processing protein DprA [Minisyncoccales bacterium]
MEKIKEISINEENYPTLLKKIKNPPKKLYYLGEIKKEEDCFALVGTRRPTPYGKEATLKIAKKLALSGLTLVSGFAPGIDTIVHQVALELKKRTIAILGTGLDQKVIYPRSNLYLIEKILENKGCLISEFPPQTKGSKFTFPKRNRLISGISLGLLVLEAKEKSGALITAQFAFEQKKKVFAVPGSIFSENSKGCHLLIQKGAFLVENGNEILEKLNLKINSLSENFSFTEKEKLIWDSLKNGEKDLEEIVKETKLSAPLVLSLISKLESEGKIKNLGGNIFSRVNF